MKTFASTTLLFVLSLSLTVANDWASWRGPTANGHAQPGQNIPTEWDDSTNILWQVEVPGHGHSSPTVVGDRIFLTTAYNDRQVQSVLCFSRSSGEMLWETEVNQGGFPERIHKKNTHASPTVACDGERAFATFHAFGGVLLAALNADNGEVLWIESAGSYVPKYPFGYAPSPTLYGDTVIVASDCEDAGFLRAFSKADGEREWTASRDSATSYSSPIVAQTGGREQLIMSGAGMIASYDPKSGAELWSVKGGPSATCGTLVWTDNLIFASGGFPSKETLAVKADGSGVVWSNGEKCYEQSMLVHDGHLYAVTDNSIAICWRVSDGKEMWKERVGGGPISASPILVDGLIYATNEAGTTHIFRATPDGYDEVAVNQLGDEAFATPTITGNRIYARVAKYSGNDRQEYLYAIGQE